MDILLDFVFFIIGYIIGRLATMHDCNNKNHHDDDNNNNFGGGTYA